jgi:hypothetical protein
MKSKPLVWVLYIVLALSLVSVTAASAQGGQAKLTVINYVGADMTFTLDGTVYTVPGTGAVPGGGQLSLTLAPGRHTYSGQVPGADGSNGEVDLTAGQTQILGGRGSHFSNGCGPAKAAGSTGFLCSQPDAASPHRHTSARTSTTTARRPGGIGLCQLHWGGFDSKHP